MSLQILVPNIFYADIQTGLKLFVDCLGFEIVYSDTDTEQPFYIVKKDTVKVYLVEDEQLALEDRPQFRIETDDIEAVYRQVHERYPELLHANSNEVALKDWGAKEFALLDESHVCIIFMQWHP